MEEETAPVHASLSGEAPSPVQPGATLAGRYRVERVLGSGGMGVVVAATHLQLGQRVALKFLLPAATNNPEAVARFLREARAAVQIESEHVARVTDVGRLDNDAPYMVMEYLEGSDLSQYPRNPPIPVEMAVDFVLQACEAIAVAHSLGIVHRDLKPANLFLTTRPDGSSLVKVLDFGISKLLETQQGRVDLTRTAAILGSPLYMSPEQIESSRSVDARTDIWALGTILHDLLTGTPPFSGDTLGAVLAAVLKAPAPPLRSLRHDVPERLERIVLRALEKEVARRFADIGEFATALSEFGPPGARLSVERVRGVLNRSSRSTPAPEPRHPSGFEAATGTNWEDAAARRGSASRARLFALLGVLTACVIVVGMLLANKLRPTMTPAVMKNEPSGAPLASVATPAIAAGAVALPSASALAAAASTSIAPASNKGNPSSTLHGTIAPVPTLNAKVVVHPAEAPSAANPLHIKFK